MPEITGEIIVALIGAGALITNTLIARKKSNNISHKLTQAKNEMGLRRESLGFARFTSEWNETQKDLNKLMADTQVDRFLIFNAWNGTLSPDWTTAVFQMRKGDQHYIDYVHAELDDAYRTILRGIEVASFAVLKTSDLTGLIKEFYLAEGVIESVWFFIDAKTIEDGSSRALSYCSFATHNLDGFNAGDVARCRAVVGRLKQLACDFDDKRVCRV